MKKRILSILTAMAVIGTMAFSLAACGEKNVSEPAPTVTPTPEVTETVKPTEIPVGSDGYKHIEGNDLKLTYIGDGVTNDTDYASLVGYDITDEQMTMNVSTTIEANNVYYEIYDVKTYNTEPEVIYAGYAGLSFSTSTFGDTADTGYELNFNRNVFSETVDESGEDYGLKPEWKDYPIVFYITNATGTRVIIDTVLSNLN